MAKNYHIVIGSIEAIALFRESTDEARMRDYIRIYKDRTGLDNYGYCFTDYCLHLAVRDREHQLNRFINGVCEAYAYYFEMKRTQKLRLRHKRIEFDPASELLDLLRFFHQRGRNSAKDYRDYSRYIKHELLDMGPVLQTLHPDELTSKELFFDEMVKEPDAEYQTTLQAREIFERDKMTKRRERAEEFLQDYLEQAQISRNELLFSASAEHRMELILRYRKETDLSFRDIGYVLGISHTSVIRLYRQRQA